MELAKAFSVQTDYKDRRNPPSWDLFLFADVVFIDKTNPGTLAHVYQLNESAHLSQMNFYVNSATSWKESCTMLGELQEVDKKKKMIRLCNKQTVSYKHLIVINGKKPLVSTINHEINNALQALMEALKVNPNVDSLLVTSWSLQKKDFHSPHASETGLLNHNSTVLKVTHPYFVDHDNNKATMGLDAFNERLYEIYI